MATIPYTSKQVYRDNDQQAWVVTWTGLTFTGGVGDVGQALDPTAFPAYVDRSVQAEGTSGAGANLVWEGSNDGVNFHVLNDHFGNQITLSSAALRGISEACDTARPRVVSGDGTTSWTVTAFLRRGLR